MKITNQDLCKLLSEKYCRQWYFNITEGTSKITFYAPCSPVFQIVVKATESNNAHFIKTAKKLDWAKVYKNTISVHVKVDDEFKIRKEYIHDKGKKTEFRFILPKTLEEVLERKLNKNFDEFTK